MIQPSVTKAGAEVSQFLRQIADAIDSKEVPFDVRAMCARMDVRGGGCAIPERCVDVVLRFADVQPRLVEMAHKFGILHDPA